MNPRRARLAVLSAVLVSFANPVPAVAASTLWEATVSTLGLQTAPGGPFSLDFQLIDGEGLGNANNTVRFSDFDFHGGGWTGASPEPIELTDSSFFSSVVSGFTPGTQLTFRLELTLNPNPGGIPDRVSFAILDQTGAEVPTLGPGDALIAIDITAAGLNPLAWGSDSGRTGISIPIPGLAPVPEPREVALLSALGLLGFGFARRWAAAGRRAR